jgi:hypothetical protein
MEAISGIMDIYRTNVRNEVKKEELISPDISLRNPVVNKVKKSRCCFNSGIPPDKQVSGFGTGVECTKEATSCKIYIAQVNPNAPAFTETVSFT